MSTENKNDSVIETMFKVGAHFGYSKTRRHPSVADCIFGSKNKVEIIDLEKTALMLSKAKEFVSKLASEGKIILFVGGKAEASQIVKFAAEKINMPYVASRWIGGTITNFNEIKKRIDKMLDLTAKKEKGELSKYTKKERLMIDREIEKLEKMFFGLVSLKQLPSAIFVVDSRHEEIATVEAHDKKIPVVSISGTDCDISGIDFPVVGNDGSVSSIKYFVNEIANAYEAGKLKKA